MYIKIIAIILVQAFLVLNISWAGGADLGGVFRVQGENTGQMIGVEQVRGMDKQQAKEIQRRVELGKARRESFAKSGRDAGNTAAEEERADEKGKAGGVGFNEIIEKMNSAGQTLRAVRVKRDGSTIVTERDIKDRVYDGKGRLKYSKIEVEKKDAGKTHAYEVSVRVRSYDAFDRIASMNIYIGDGFRLTTQEITDIRYDEQGRMTDELIGTVINDVRFTGGTWLSYSMAGYGSLWKYTMYKRREKIEGVTYDESGRMNSSEAAVEERGSLTRDGIMELRYPAYADVASEFRDYEDYSEKVREYAADMVSGYRIIGGGDSGMLRDEIIKHGSIKREYIRKDYFEGSYRKAVSGISFEDQNRAAAMADAALEVLKNDVPQITEITALGRKEDEKTIITLSANDADGDSLTYEIVVQPLNGALTEVDPGKYIYTPNLNFNGTEIITFRAFDGTAYSDERTLDLVIMPVNDAPIANAYSSSLDEDTVSIITLSAGDVDGDGLIYEIISRPLNGILTEISLGRYTYTPNADYNGADAFTYRAFDGEEYSNEAAADITIEAVNDPPVMEHIEDIIVSAGEDIVISLNLTDADNDSLTVAYSSETLNITSNTYTAVDEDLGTHIITVRVSDGIETVSQDVAVAIEERPSPSRKINPDNSYTDYSYDSEGVLSEYINYFPDGSFQRFDGADVLLFEYRVQEQELIDYTNQPKNPESKASVTLTADDGTLITYTDNLISSVQKTDGTAIKNLALDAEGNLRNGVIKLTDGTIQVVLNNRLIQTVKPQGVILRYKDGLADTELNAGILNFYTYERDPEEKILFIIITSSERIVRYDAEGRLVKISKTNGRITEFKQGRIDKIVTARGTEYLYSQYSGNPSILLKLNRIIEADGEIVDYSDTLILSDFIPVSIKYDLSGKIIEINQSDGSAIHYQDGLINRIIDKDGNITAYSYLSNSSNDLGGITVQRDDILRRYDNLGSLKQLITDGNTINYTDGKVSSIKQQGGALIDDIDFDSEGNLNNAVITTSDGTIKTYQDKQLTHLLKPDGLTIEYKDGKINRVIDSYNRQYNWHYEQDTNGDQVTVIKDTFRDETRRYKNGLLQSVINKDGLTVSYQYQSNDKISKSVVSADGEIIHTYTYSYSGANAEITQITDEQGAKRIYDSKGVLTSLTTAEGKTYVYTYSTDVQEKEKTAVYLRDINGTTNFAADERVLMEYNSKGVIIKSRTANGMTTYYVDGLTDKIVDKDGWTIADYEYDSDYNLVSMDLIRSKEMLISQVAVNKQSITQQRETALALVSCFQQIFTFGNFAHNAFN